MQIQTQIFDYIVSLLGITVKSQLSTNGGYALQIAPSSPEQVYFDKEADSTLSFLLLGKNKNQQTLADSLYKICNNLRKRTDYSHGIYAIEVNEPSLVDIKGGYYIWSCIINVKYETGGN